MNVAMRCQCDSESVPLSILFTFIDLCCTSPARVPVATHYSYKDCCTTCTHGI